jgi:DNA-binding response OmpR family regulator
LTEDLPLILLVEDDADTAALYSAMLAAEGMEVVHCADCAEALRWWLKASRRPDLMVVDMRLPDGDGVELCRSLLTQEPAMPPIMILSAHGDPRMPSLCQRAGAAAFLDKLSGMDRFVDTARGLIHNPACIRA